jgi:dTDP-4-amino-4,6-dideoxygalactose transaminase
MINVTKTYLPPLEEYTKYLEDIWKTSWVTNQGPLVQELEKQLQSYLGVKNIQFVSNGTIALQLAIKALDLKGTIITTPFSYVATTTSILWENCTPVFVDIEDKTFCIDTNKIEGSITEQTCAILATHVYGYPCDVDKIEKIAKRHNLKVIYDGAHAFDVKVNNTSILNFGDVSTLSFHATKLFHTIEGGALVTNDDELAEKIFLYKSFGHRGDDYFTIGINGKNSEFHAAMGLCNLPKVQSFIQKRKEIFNLYIECLSASSLQFPEKPKNVEYNYAYFPIVFSCEKEMMQAKNLLAENKINTRRYFFPSLNKLPYFSGNCCNISEDIASRVLCLPFYQQLEVSQVKNISEIILKSLKQ